MLSRKPTAYFLSNQIVPSNTSFSAFDDASRTSLNVILLSVIPNFEDFSIYNFKLCLYHRFISKTSKTLRVYTSCDKRLMFFASIAITLAAKNGAANTFEMPDFFTS